MGNRRKQQEALPSAVRNSGKRKTAKKVASKPLPPRSCTIPGRTRQAAKINPPKPTQTEDDIPPEAAALGLDAMDVQAAQEIGVSFEEWALENQPFPQNLREPSVTADDIRANVAKQHAAADDEISDEYTDEGEGIDELQSDGELEVSLPPRISSKQKKNTRYIEVSDSDEETAEPTFEIHFEVPIHRGTKFLKGLTSKSTYDDFQKDVAEKMRIKPHHLPGLAYWPLTLAKGSCKTAKPALLEGDEDWDCLVEAAQVYVREQRRKKKTSSVVQFDLVDLDADDDKKKPTSVKGSKPALKAKKDDSDGNNDSAGQGTTELQIRKKIEASHGCNDHVGRICFVMEDGKCYTFAENEISTWIHLCKKHAATCNEVPDVIKPSGLIAQHQNHARSSYNKNKGFQNPAPNDTMSFMGGLLGGMMGLNQFGSFPLNQPWQPAPLTRTSGPAPLPANQTLPQTPSRSSRAESAPPDSPSKQSKAGTKRPADSPLQPYNPEVAEWLRLVEGSVERNGVAHFEYSKHAEGFIANGYVELSDLASLTEQEVADATSMSKGQAKRLLKYAKEDYVSPKRAKF
ncbi:hypothetical protein DL96DRAFT_1781867 [Flagelloscypha sp. PMI_526]|nr:hypothetical protein DL96DRAFT_1781867 [Flagelloscypha sp. PMI_526]